jgi:hypothetical protein
MRIAVVPVAIVVALGLAACSSGDKTSTASSNTTSAASATTVASGTTYTGDANSKFCQLGADFSDRFSNITSSLSGGVDKAKTEITALRDVITQAKANAPASVKADVQTLADAFQQFFDQLQAAGFNITKLPSDAATKLQGPEVQNAAKDLVTYGQQVCGLDATGSTP